MGEPRRAPPAHVLPTLTEVVTEGRSSAGTGTEPAAAPPVAVPGAADEARIVDTVVAGLQQRIDLMFEYRMKEALAPVLSRAAEVLVHEAREELARTLRDVVARAVSQELARRRSR